VALSWRVLRDRQDAQGASLTGDRPARLNFRYSLAYLAAIFVAIAADRIVRGP
jgi:protoheme IX farnesyltransferase